MGFCMPARAVAYAPAGFFVSVYLNIPHYINQILHYL